MLPNKILKIRRLEVAIFGHFCDLTVKKFRSLHFIFTRLQYRWKHSFVIHESFSHLSLFMIPQVLYTKIHDSAYTPEDLKVK